ncbi:MAG: exodeoxyribonuclease III [Clostridiales Family XIII bacterium]|jgi:exodeoxyribonuclease-3|nr:exodeoxyribonuclease III [Clostridiales Family XIII bacterium]
MKLITWNVNGLRAAMKKGLLDFCANEMADAYCFQETKMQPGQAVVDLPDYHEYWNSAVKKGYSGTAVFSKAEPLSVRYGIDDPAHEDEGRALTCEFEKFFLVCEYTPNAQDGLARIDYRMEWEDARRAYLEKLDREKPVILCGDLNVAHEEIDLKNPKSNHGNAGFSDEERGRFRRLLGAGFTDTYRHLHPDTEGDYTWWSFRYRAWDNNAGWRIDYFLVSNRIADKVREVTHLRGESLREGTRVSDHCPVRLIIDI